MFKPIEIPEHESPLRRMIAESRQSEYETYANLDETKIADDSVVILEGDWGGQIYLVCPVKLIRCNEQTLHTLLQKLDAMAWACNEGQGARLYLERRRIGEGIAGGMGGGMANGELWIHPDLVAQGLTQEIRKMLFGL